MTLDLRPYQIRDVEQLGAAFNQGARAVCYVSPTGSGKTVVFSHIIGRVVSKGRRVGILVHRRELVHQAATKLSWAGVPHGIIGAGLDRDHDAPMSVQSAARRLDRLPNLDFAVADEGHHSVSPSWAQVLATWPEAKILGATATPERLDGKGLGGSVGGIFDSLVIGAAITELQLLGYLAKTRVFVPARLIDTRGVHRLGGDFKADELAIRANAVTGDAVAEYRLRADHQPAIAYGCTVEHAQSIAGAFCGAGYRSACVHGGLSMLERDRLIQGLATGEIEILTSCDLISEGLDVPSVGAVILLRPTESLALAMQQIGRGMRPAEGKEHLVVLDHAGNCLKHGLPDEPREWSLEGRPKRNGPGREVGWRCEACGLLND
jgi:DNA repair protein RadD